MSQLKYWNGTAWVDAVIGAQGTTGIQGVQGTLGNQGITGTGTQGIQGPTGLQGTSGTAVPDATPFVTGVVYGTTYAGDTALGYQAGAGLTGPAYLTAIGEQAAANAPGLNNTVVGYAAMNALYDSSAGNTVIGSDAMGIAQTTAENNTIVGFQAGNTLTDGNNNIIIGKDSQPSAASTSNEITIGNATNDRLRIPGLGIDWTSSTVPGGGGKVLINHTVVSGGMIELTVPTGYTQLQLIFRNVYTSTYGVGVRFKDNANSTYFDIQAARVTTQVSTNGVSSANSAPFGVAELTPYGVGGNISGVANIYNYDAADTQPIFADADMSLLDGTPEFNSYTSSIAIGTTSGAIALDTIQIYGADSGDIYFYGIS